MVVKISIEMTTDEMVELTQQLQVRPTQGIDDCKKIELPIEIGSKQLIDFVLIATHDMPSSNT